MARALIRPSFAAVNALIWALVIVSTFLEIAVANALFKGEKASRSLADLFWPPASWWFACFLFAVVFGEAVRRKIMRKDHDRPRNG